jgi:hypothetical protein
MRGSTRSASGSLTDRDQENGHAFQAHQVCAVALLTLTAAACDLDLSDPNVPPEEDVLTSPAAVLQVGIGLQAEYSNQFATRHTTGMVTNELGANTATFESFRVIDTGSGPATNDFGRRRCRGPACIASCGTPIRSSRLPRMWDSGRDGERPAGHGQAVQGHGARQPDPDLRAHPHRCRTDHRERDVRRAGAVYAEIIRCSRRLRRTCSRRRHRRSSTPGPGTGLQPAEHDPGDARAVRAHRRRPPEGGRRRRQPSTSACSPSSASRRTMRTRSGTSPSTAATRRRCGRRTSSGSRRSRRRRVAYWVTEAPLRASPRRSTTSTGTATARTATRRTCRTRCG